MNMLRSVAEVVENHATLGAVPCCEFVRLVLRELWGAQLVDVVPIWRWNLWTDRGAGPWEPVLAARDAMLTDEVFLPTVGGEMHPRYLAPQRWYVAQGWRGEPLAKGVTGHTFFVRALASRTVAVVDATERREPSARFEDYAALCKEFDGGLATARLRRS